MIFHEQIQEIVLYLMVIGATSIYTYAHYTHIHTMQTSYSWHAAEGGVPSGGGGRLHINIRHRTNINHTFLGVLGIFHDI